MDTARKKKKKKKKKKKVERWQSKKGPKYSENLFYADYSSIIN